MFKVFLVEDESLIREGLRDNVPWEQCGFQFAGEAPDGEIALSKIRNTSPDLLITDIKMPFMDGLSLCRQVCRDLPETKIVLLSGYDDFEYARQAIELRASRYLLKPVTKKQMIETLDSVRSELEKEREQKEYLGRYAKEAQQYEQYSRRQLFEDMALGKSPVSEIYERADALGINLNAACYNIVLFTIRFDSEEYSERTSYLRDELVDYFCNQPEYHLFRWGFMDYSVLIMDSEEHISEQTELCVRQIQRRCEAENVEPKWYVAAGTPVERLSALPECFAKANRALEGRYFLPDVHIQSDRSFMVRGVGDGNLDDLFSLNATLADPMVLRNFMQIGRAEEIPGFIDGYIEKLGKAANSLMFQQYLMINARFNALIMVNSFGCTQQEFLDGLALEPIDGMVASLRDCMVRILSRAIQLRDRNSQTQYRRLVKEACNYIDQHFSDETISLNTVARSINVSTNYFSAVFSREMGLTFIEYLTQKRMERACQLLRGSDMRTSEIGFEVGYKDPCYFSFLFKKIMGSSPREFRTGKGGGE